MRRRKTRIANCTYIDALLRGPLVCLKCTVHPCLCIKILIGEGGEVHKEREIISSVISLTNFPPVHACELRVKKELVFPFSALNLLYSFLSLVNL